jgi:polar amino acid transport system substrate-binding protein
MMKPAGATLAILMFVTAANSQTISSTVRAELLPRGTLRVGINFGNALLANRDASGNPGGIAVDLARELARRLNAPMEIIGYNSAGEMADGARSGAWDVAFLGTDPDRAGEIDFTPPYVEIDSTYLVPPNSPLRTIDDVDREGVRIAISEKSAYDLFLTRTLKRAQLVRIPGVVPSFDLFFAQKLEALAGLRPLLIEAADRQPGSRVLDGSYTTVRQAAGTPKGRAAAAAYLSEFIRDAKMSGLVAETIQKNGLRGLTIAP